MARYITPIATLVTLALLAGCQQTSTGVANYTRPSFDPPTIRQQAPLVVHPLPNNHTKPNIVNPPPVWTGVPREWLPLAQSRPWQWIVIHHSATNIGGAARFDREHKSKNWDELGYHFVIGNGTDTRDGLVEVGSRWPKQKWGAHTKTADNRYNNFGIGICLVGNFENSTPSRSQMQALSQLVAYLMKTYRIPPERIVGHRDCKATDCPGRHVNIADVRRQAQQVLATQSFQPPVHTASRTTPQR